MSNVNIEWKNKRQGFLLLSVISFTIASYYLFQNLSDNYKITNNELVEVKNLLLSESPQLLITEGRYSYEYIQLKFQHYDKYFNVSKEELKCCNKLYILNAITQADTITIKILKDDFENINELGFFNKDNEIFSIVKNGSEMINLDCLNEDRFKENLFGYKILFVLSFLSFLSYLIRKQPQIFGINLDISIFIFVLIIIVFA